MKTEKGITTKVVQWAPKLIRVTLYPLPNFFQACGLEWAINQTLKNSLRQGELSFMNGRSVSVQVVDIGLNFSLTEKNQQLKVSLSDQQGDVTIKGDLMVFLTLIGGKVDPDTLFFSRRLSLNGDTELGLHVKNFLDTLEIEAILPRPIVQLLEKLPATP
ncbi:SCP2 domain-containing protein [Marinimicrobium sp. ABcell2]|uniref:ubiquinone anaerobic biosynthesis accessory factor UbiT n=1 Tax=Marinimicrobium sp. ABcell2 TaxID=3069751 RepID=UPI0027B155D1|nr:SCP2 sterol-binding domain-containing protein [Marinimicrobium sp. ABcell2]MDQ2076431.1 SCP2 sterol-binding domain-containing protein [Marinimicrobium sp. ABcell2]